jgi:hypothetical protein
MIACTSYDYNKLFMIKLFNLRHFMTNEPDWMNPANDRKTPYTDEELELFVDGFIEGFKDEWKDLKSKFGELMARRRIKDGFIANDENNLLNIEPGDEVH